MILNAAFFIMAMVYGFSGMTYSQAQQSSQPTSSKSPSAESQPRQRVAASRNAAEPEADSDSADIPPFARDKIDEATYFRLRAEQLRLKRGISDLMRNPQARSSAIRKMERQERLIREQMEAQRQSAGTSAVAAAPPSWTPLGPSPIPNGQTSPSEVPVSGRVTAIAVDPADPNTVYVGAAQGGLYRSQNGGVTWTALMDAAQSLAIGAITIDPLDHTKVFVGTGESSLSGDSFFGVGVYLITNATSVTPVISGPFNSNGASDIFTGNSISRILVNPTNDSQIMVATTSGFSGMSFEFFNTLPATGVYLSTNAMSATPTFALQAIQGITDRDVTDIAMDPGNPNTIVVNVFGLANAGDGGLWTSTSGNPWAGTATWTQKVTKEAIGKLAVNRSGAGPATTFFATFGERASCTPPSGPPVTVGGTMMKSTDGGLTWLPVPAATGFCGGQCFYDMVTAVDPTNVNNIYLAGAAGSRTGSCGSGIMGKSTDGGAHFSPLQANLHADSHATAIAPSNPQVVYAGNDGGIFQSTNAGVTWFSMNTAGFNATQFESLSVHPTDPNFAIGGTQDNGTPLMKPDGSWTRVDFGDGGFSAIDQNAIDTTSVIMYHTYFNQTNNLVGYAEVNTGVNATEGTWNFFGCGSGNPGNNGINCADSVLFYAPLALGPGNPNTVYYGSDHLYRSANSGTLNTAVSQVFSAGVPVSAIGISPQDDNVRIVGLANGQVFATSTGANPMVNVTGGWAAMYIARAVIDPSNKATAYVTLDGYGTPAHVWKTVNLSSATPTWASASVGLPDVPVNAFAVDPSNSNVLYAGADIGVFASSDGGATWNPYGAGLPRVAVFDMKVVPVNHRLRVGTHGRGAWEIVGLASDLTVAKTHVGNFLQGQTGATYTITVSNAGTASTGLVTITDTVPVGLTATGISGSNWICPTLTSCHRSDVLASGNSYEPITLTVSVAGNAPGSVINSVTVSGGGEVNTSNDTANDVTTIVNQTFLLTVTKQGTGTGTVTSNIGAINCGATCSSAINSGSIVTLTATPATGSIFTGWGGACSGIQTCMVTMNAAQTVSATFTLGQTGLLFVPTTACRIADTRNPNGPFGGPFLSGQTSRGFTIPGSACNIPATAQAYSLNVTAAPHGPLGFLTTFPCGQSQPLVSTLNSNDGRVKAVAAIVPAGTNGAVCFFVTNDTELVLDIDGYFVPATTPNSLSFYPVTPCRLVDTRLPAGPLGGPSLAGNATGRSFPILSSPCNLPVAAQAYSLNYTSVPKTGTLGFLTTWPAGQPQPLVSTLNAPTGAVTANAAIVPAGTGGAVEVFVTNDSDLVIDVNGYFAPPATGGLALFNLPPCRVLDTRNPQGSPPLTGSRDVNIMTSGCGAPASAQSYVLNATVVPSSTLGFLTLWPQGGSQPLVSTLNAIDGAVTSNMALVPTTNGSVSAFASNPSHLVLDISGYFAATASSPALLNTTNSITNLPVNAMQGSGYTFGFDTNWTSSLGCTPNMLYMEGSQLAGLTFNLFSGDIGTSGTPATARPYAITAAADPVTSLCVKPPTQMNSETSPISVSNTNDDLSK